MEKGRDKEEELQELENDLMDDLREIVAEWSDKAGEIEKVDIGLEKNDIHVDEVALLWIPR